MRERNLAGSETAASEAGRSRRGWLPRARPPWRRRRDPADRPLVLVSGFGWSGSSALSDVMLEHERVVRPPEGEVKYLVAMGRLLSRPWEHAPDVEAFAQGDIVPGGRFDTTMNRRRVRRFRADAGVDAAGFARRTAALVEELRAAGLGRVAQGEPLDPDVTTDVFTRYLLTLHETHQPAGALAIYDNMLAAYQLRLLKHLDLDRLPELRVHVVDRDPRDQFVELHAEGRARAEDLDDFLDVFRARRERYRRAARAVGRQRWERLVHEVGFEALVAEEGTVAETVRAELEELLADTVGRGRWHLGEAFRAHESRANVGKWRAAPDQAVHERIREELAPWCVQG